MIKKEVKAIKDLGYKLISFQYNQEEDAFSLHFHNPVTGQHRKHSILSNPKKRSETKADLKQLLDKQL